MLAAGVDEEALVARLERFAAAYRAMSRFLLAPADSELQEALAEPGQLESWPMPRDPDTARGIELLIASLAAKETVEALGHDYECLLTGPGSMLPPPFESVHRSLDRLLFDGTTFEVRAEYRRLGLQAPNFNREPDDHIGLEFSFLALVCEHALEAIESKDPVLVNKALETQRRFLAEHLLAWGGECLGLLEANAKTAFYKGVGALGLGVLVQAAVW